MSALGLGIARSPDSEVGFRGLVATGILARFQGRGAARTWKGVIGSVGPMYLCQLTRNV